MGTSDSDLDIVASFVLGDLYQGKAPEKDQAANIANHECNANLSRLVCVQVKHITKVLRIATLNNVQIGEKLRRLYWCYKKSRKCGSVV